MWFRHPAVRRHHDDGGSRVGGTMRPFPKHVFVLYK